MKNMLQTCCMHTAGMLVHTMDRIGITVFHSFVDMLQTCCTGAASMLGYNTVDTVDCMWIQ